MCWHILIYIKVSSIYIVFWGVGLYHRIKYLYCICIGKTSLNISLDFTIIYISGCKPSSARMRLVNFNLINKPEST